MGSPTCCRWAHGPSGSSGRPFHSSGERPCRRNTRRQGGLSSLHFLSWGPSHSRRPHSCSPGVPRRRARRPAPHRSSCPARRCPWPSYASRRHCLPCQLCLTPWRTDTGGADSPYRHPSARVPGTSRAWAGWNPHLLSGSNCLNCCRHGTFRLRMPSKTSLRTWKWNFSCNS